MSNGFKEQKAKATDVVVVMDRSYSMIGTWDEVGGKPGENYGESINIT